MHSPLTIVVHKIFYRILHPFGWNAWYAISASSAFAGALALQVLYAICHHPLFLAMNVLSGSFLVFVGEVENYAWVNLFLYLTYLALQKYFQEEWCFWPVALFFFTACAFHMLALFYILPLYWVMKRHPRLHPAEFLLPLLGFITVVIVLNFSMNAKGLDMGTNRLVPLFEIQRKGQFFTFFEWAHWEILLLFHWRASLFYGYLPIEWPLLWVLRNRINTPLRTYLFLCTLVGLAWTTIWHPDLGKLDWDLFSQMYIPFHILLGLLLSDYPIRFSRSIRER